jgi:hypothetical protein
MRRFVRFFLTGPGAILVVILFWMDHQKRPGQGTSRGSETPGTA